MTTGKTDAMSRLATSGCETCATLSDRVEQVYGQGGEFKGGNWIVRAISYTPLDGSNALVLLSLNVEAQKIIEREGAVPSASPETRGSVELRLEGLASGLWMVSHLDA
jgi:hypothetical protein